jgi:hypothetical protein
MNNLPIQTAPVDRNQSSRRADVETQCVVKNDGVSPSVCVNTPLGSVCVGPFASDAV